MSIRLFSLAFLVSMLVVFGGCGDDGPCKEGEVEQGGPSCCAGGCGMSTDGWSARICQDGQWICEGSNPVLEDACAAPDRACSPLEACVAVGLNAEEPDPAPELCCDGGCEGTTPVHRVCKDGTLWECPGGSVPISACKDYKSACGGILKKYRDNGYSLP